MKISKLKNYTRGWFIGNFLPTAVSSKEAEVAVKQYKAGDVETKHYHLVATEITCVVNGVMKMNETILNPGDVVVIEPNEAVEFSCLESGSTVVVKLPCCSGDKYLCADTK